VLYDLSSSYVGGRCCPLATLGYSRDGKKGKLQVNYGLICSPAGRPVGVRVHEGRTTDSQTVPDTVHTIRERFGIEQVVFVGDRGMITQAHATSFKEQGVDFISALKSVQIRSLVNSGELQLSLFDEVNLAEITSTAFPGERLVVCRNPAVAAERARKRSELLAATEIELEKVKTSVHGPRGQLRGADAGQIGQRAGRVVNKYKVAKHFALTIADGAFADERKTDQIDSEAALDGLYVIRTTLPQAKLGAPAAVRAYKQLKLAEHAFRAMKDTIEIRPIHHHLEDRVRDSRVPLHARLLRRLRTRTAPRAAAIHRRNPTHPDRPRRAGHPLPVRPREGRQRPHPGRASRPHPPRPTRRPRHPDTQPDPHRRQRTHLRAPDHTHPAPSRSPSPRTTRHQALHVAKAKPARTTRIPHHHTGFNISTVKLDFRGFRRRRTLVVIGGA
jgi:hypothetical protein